MEEEWTILKVLQWTTEYFRSKGFEQPRADAEVLLAHALGLERIRLYLNYDRPLSHDELARFRSLIRRRAAFEPAQYITGKQEFWSLPFEVTPSVLIPRPETETLIEQAMLECRELEAARTVSIIELGTGSGNIAVALAKFVKNASVVSIDNSQDAIDLARENAVAHNVAARIEFSVMDMFEPVDQLLLRRFDLLVSNPPYISAEEWETLPTEVKRYEPRSALTDSRDGYEHHQRIVELAPYLLKNDGTLLVEVGFGQARPVCDMLRKSGFRDVVSIPDLQGVQRVVKASCPSKVRGQLNVN